MGVGRAGQGISKASLRYLVRSREATKDNIVLVVRFVTSGAYDYNAVETFDCGLYNHTFDLSLTSYRNLGFSKKVHIPPSE